MSDAFSDPNTMGELRAEIARLRTALSKQNDEICQALGSALGYPKFCDDQQTFPGATESSGVCTGDHVAESIAVEAAALIERQAREIAALQEATTWRGIESAPDHGMGVLVVTSDIPEPHIRPANGKWWRLSEGSSVPTRWMPIPKEPTP